MPPLYNIPRRKTYFALHNLIHIITCLILTKLSRINRFPFLHKLIHIITFPIYKKLRRVNVYAWSVLHSTDMTIQQLQ